MIGYVWASNLLLYLALQRLAADVRMPGWRRSLALGLAALAAALVVFAAYQWAPVSAYGRGLTREALQAGWAWTVALVVLQLSVFYAYTLQVWYRQRHPAPVTPPPVSKKRRRQRPHRRSKV